MASKPRSIELFTGAGGLAIATHRAGFSHESLFEWNGDACDTLRANAEAEVLNGIRSWRIRQGDVQKVNFRDFAGVDLVAGGPPCQPFSIGGNHQGKNDRRDMIPEFIRAVREIRPRAFILENVKGLTRQSFRNYFSYATLQLTYPDEVRLDGEKWTSHLARLEDIHTHGCHFGLAYNVVHRVVNAADYGVPQTRERVFVVGFRSDLCAHWHFPDPTHSEDALHHEQWVSGDYWARHEVRQPQMPDSLARRVSRLESLDGIRKQAWRTVRDSIHDLPTPTHRESKTVLNHRLQSGARQYVGHTGSAIDWPSKTLKAGDHGVPGGENMILFPNGDVRYFTVREAARIQTFPDNWKFNGAWTEAMRQLGNAVPVQLAQVLASSVAAELGRLSK